MSVWRCPCSGEFRFNRGCDLCELMSDSEAVLHGFYEPDSISDDVIDIRSDEQELEGDGPLYRVAGADFRTDWMSLKDAVNHRNAMPRTITAWLEQRLPDGTVRRLEG